MLHRFGQLTPHIYQLLLAKDNLFNQPEILSENSSSLNHNGYFLAIDGILLRLRELQMELFSMQNRLNASCTVVD